MNYFCLFYALVFLDLCLLLLLFDAFRYELSNYWFSLKFLIRFLTCAFLPDITWNLLNRMNLLRRYNRLWFSFHTKLFCIRIRMFIHTIGVFAMLADSFIRL